MKFRKIGNYAAQCRVLIGGIMLLSICAAAIAARDADARVLVLEKMPEGKEGGNTRISGGIWFHNPDVEGQKSYLRAASPFVGN